MNRATPRPAVVLALLGVLALAGCGAAADPVPTPSAPAPSLSAATPAEESRTLRDLGLTHGPVDAITLPATVTVLQLVDQANSVTLVLEARDGEPTAEHLVATLPAAGFEVTASVPGSLTFTGQGWDGAFTTSSEVSGFTLRRID